MTHKRTLFAVCSFEIALILFMVFHYVYFG